MEQELDTVFLCYSSCLADVLIKSFLTEKRKAIMSLDKENIEGKQNQE